jgi:hypothetical protein
MPGFHFSMNRAALLAGTAFAGSNHSSVCVHGKILTRLVTSTSVVKNPACHSGYWKREGAASQPRRPEQFSEMRRRQTKNGISQASPEEIRAIFT